jgi:hypothetical protein
MSCVVTRLRLLRDLVGRKYCRLLWNTALFSHIASKSWVGIGPIANPELSTKMKLIFRLCKEYR